MTNIRYLMLSNYRRDILVNKEFNVSFIFLLVSLFIASLSGTEIIVISLNFLYSISGIANMYKSYYSINIIIILFIFLLPSHYIGKNIGNSNAIILGFIITTIGLVMLSMLDIPGLATSTFCVGISIIFISSLNLIFQRTKNFQYASIYMLLFFYTVIVGTIIGLHFHTAIVHAFNVKNTYLLSGIINVFGLAIFILNSHFLLERADEPQLDKRKPSHIYGTIIIVIISIMLGIAMLHITKLSKLLSIVILIALIFTKIKDEKINNKIYLLLLATVFFYWMLASAGQFVSHNNSFSLFWKQDIFSRFPTARIPISNLDLKLNILIALVLAIAFLLFTSNKKSSISYLQGMALSFFILAVGQLTMSVPYLLKLYENIISQNVVILCYQIYIVLYIVAVSLFFCYTNTLAGKLFINKKHIIAFAEIGFVAALSWSLVVTMFIVSNRSYTLRFVYPYFNIILGISSFTVGILVYAFYLRLRDCCK